MSSPAIAQPTDDQFDVVQHPTLGTLKFPKDMPPDERNMSIVRAMGQRSGTGSSQPSFWQRMGIVPSEEQMNNIPTGKDEQAGPTINGSGGVGDMMIQGMGNLADKGLDWYGANGPKQMGSGIADVARGDISKGGHKIISGAGVSLLPVMPEAIATNPAMAIRAIGGGIVGGTAAGAVAKTAGADPDQQQFAGDLGGLAGGAAAGLGLPRAALEAFMRKNPQSLDLVLKALQPKKTATNYLQNMLDSVRPQSSSVTTEDAATGTITGTAQGPVPAEANTNNKYVSPNPPRSNLAKNQAQMAKATASGPIESPTEQGAIAQNSNLNSPSEAQGFLEQASQKLFNKPYDQLSVTEKLKTLQEGGRMQQEARTSAAAPVDAEQGGHAGNGVASVEELNRPGANYLVSKSGGITYHGKSFAPEGTPQGSSHVTVLPNGEFRVNAGPELNPLQAQMLRKSLPDTVPQTPRVPASDADRMELLMQSLKARGR